MGQNKDESKNQHFEFKNRLLTYDSLFGSQDNQQWISNEYKLMEMIFVIV